MMIHLNAGNDKNGNPRRAYVLYNEFGCVKNAWNEGYHGYNAVPENYVKMAQNAPMIQTTPKFYREVLRDALMVE